MPYAVEPVCDVAVLGAMDGQENTEECEKYEEFCESITAIQICRKEIIGEFDVNIFTHKGTWISGRANPIEGQTGFRIDTEQQIESGTSGSPVMNNKGKIIGVVSDGSKEPYSHKQTYSAHLRWPHLSLPIWILNKIFEKPKPLREWKKGALGNDLTPKDCD